MRSALRFLTSASVFLLQPLPKSPHLFLAKHETSMALELLVEDLATVFEILQAAIISQTYTLSILEPTKLVCDSYQSSTRLERWLNEQVQYCFSYNFINSREICLENTFRDACIMHPDDHCFTGLVSSSDTSARAKPRRFL